MVVPAEGFMNDIVTSPRATCTACGKPGRVLQSGVRDPDGYIAGEWSFRQCTDAACALVWLDPAPLPSELWKAYTTYHTHTRDASKRFEKMLLSLCNRLIKLAFLPLRIASGLQRDVNRLRFMTLDDRPAGKLLDVGCGGGRFLHRMRKRGWEVEGTDFDPKCAANTAARYGVKTHVGELVVLALPAASFDAITMSHAVEHLFDPRATITECLRLLKPGGLLVLVTPNIASTAASEMGRFWRGWEPPRHLHLFSVASLTNLVQGRGFEIVEARSLATGSAAVHRVSCLNRMKETGKQTVFAQIRLLVWSYRMEMREHRALATLPDSGEDVLVRARKPGHGAPP